ncbi:hypothetical protein [Denitrobacterium detoxificans]|nr:hypothetical protein [Denitrobacterium detoxificans]
MKFAKGVLSAFMAVVTVVGFTPIVPYQAHAVEPESAPPASVQVAEEAAQLSAQESVDIAQTSVSSDTTTQADPDEAATQGAAQLQPASEGDAQLSPADNVVGVSCIWNNQYYVTVAEAIAAIDADDTVTQATITMIGNSSETSDALIKKDITLLLEGKTLDMNTQAWVVSGDNAALSISTSADGGKITASGHDAISIQAGELTLDSGEINVTGLDAGDEAAIMVGEDGSFVMRDGTVSADNGIFAVSVAGSFSMSDGNLNGGVYASGSAEVELRGSSSLNTNGSSVSPLDVSGPVIISAGAGVMVEGNASVSLTHVYVNSTSTAPGAVVYGGNLIVDNSMVISDGGYGLSVTGGSAVVQDNSMVGTLADNQYGIYAELPGSVEVFSESANETKILGHEGYTVGGDLLAVLVHANVLSNNKIPYQAIEEGYVCTYLESKDMWVINKAPNAPVAIAPVFDYAGQQSIISLEGGQVIGEPVQYDSKVVADTDAGYTLEYQKSVSVGDQGKTLMAENLGDYNVLATLKDGFTWADGTTAPKVVSTTIIADIIASPTPKEDVVYSGAALSLYTFEEGTVFIGHGTVDDSTSPYNGYKWVSTNKGYTIYYLDNSGITVDFDANTINAVNAGSYGILVNLVDPTNTTWPDGSTGEFTVVGTIQKQPVTVPTAVENVVYTGSAQEVIDYGDGVTFASGATFPDVPVVTSAGYSIALTAKPATPGTAVGLNVNNEIVGNTAGTYTFTASIAGGYDNYEWADGGSADKTINATIAKAPVDKPKAIDDLVYNGEAQQIIDLGEGMVTGWDYDVPANPTAINVYTNLGYNFECAYYADFAVSEGQIVGTNAGSYGPFTATLNDNYIWSDNSIATYSVTGNIARKPVLVPEAIDDLTYTGAFQQVVDLNGDEITADNPGNEESDPYKAETDGGYYIIYPHNATGLHVSGGQLIAKDAGVYSNVKAYLDDNYEWFDAPEGYSATDPIPLYPAIDQAVITVPTVSVEGNTTEWTGEPIELMDLQGAVVLRTYVESGKTVAYTNKGYFLTYPLNVTYDNGKLYATSVGDYDITAYRENADNYVWSDEVLTPITDPREFRVSITKILTPAPTKIEHEAYVYDGDKKPLVDLGDAMILEYSTDPDTGVVTALTDSGYSLVYDSKPIVDLDTETNCLVGTDAGDYHITAVLDEGHEWATGADPEVPKVFDDEIARHQITKPIPDPSSFEYTGEPQVLVAGGEGYELSCDDLNVTIDEETGDAIATEIGKFEITATLDNNYAWAGVPNPDTEPFVAAVSIDRIVIDKPEYEPLITYTGEPQVLVAGGVGYTLSTDDPDVTIDPETGDAIATEVGVYEITATLAEHYAWDDDPEPSIDPLDYDVEISEDEVAIPEAVANLEYTGEPQVIVPGNEHYQLKIDNGEWLEPGQDAVVIENQNYVVTAKLVDSDNYVWEDGTTENKTINAMISKGRIPVPAGVEELVFSGEEQVIAEGGLGEYGLVPSAEAIAAGAELNPLTGDVLATDAGTYRISATLVDPDHYMWANGAIIDQEFDAVIAKKPIEIPEQTLELEYVRDGQIALEASDYYTFTPSAGSPVITEDGVVVDGVGVYAVVASLDDTANTEWADKASGVRVSTITVTPKAIAAPTVVEDLTYNREAQTMVAGGEGYQLAVGTGEPLAEGTDATATDAGDYEITATLYSDNYVWNLVGNLDGQVHLNCTIDRYKVIKPKAVEGLVYNRTAQTLVKGGEGYTLGVYDGGLHMTGLPDPDATFPEGKDATAIDANEYTVIAMLVDTDNYRWVDGLEGTTGYDIDPVELDTEIAKANISTASVTASNMAYTGAPLEPAATVKMGSDTLTYNTDYTVAYSNNKEVGTATITVTGKGNYTGTATGTFKIVESVPMFRLYNPNSGEHFYTQSTNERDNLKKLGWQYEGIGWYAPSSSNTPVYRLYNPNGGDHHYTVSVNERDMLKKAGWKYEGIGWYSDDAMGVKVLREYNPNATSGSHNFTTSESEHKHLVSLGWRDEGTAWYAVAVVS